MIIGLSSEQLKRLAISGRQFQKTARRDIAHVVSTPFPFPGHSVWWPRVLITIKDTAITQTPRASVVCQLVANIAAMEILNARQLSYGSQTWVLCWSVFESDSPVSVIATLHNFLFPSWQVASGGNGATTVSATMFFAHKVPWKTFAKPSCSSC